MFGKNHQEDYKSLKRFVGDRVGKSLGAEYKNRFSPHIWLMMLMDFLLGMKQVLGAEFGNKRVLLVCV